MLESAWKKDAEADFEEENVRIETAITHKVI